MIRFLQRKDKILKWVLAGMLLLISAAMVISLVPGGFLGDDTSTANAQGTIASVGGQPITLLQVEDRARSIARQQFGGRSVPEQLMPFLESQAANQMITDKAQEYEAER